MIQECFERVRVVVNDLARKLALTMTPEGFTGQIEKAG